MLPLRAIAHLALGVGIFHSLTPAYAEPPPQAPVAELLEDDAQGLLKLLTNPTGDPGEGRVENTDVFSGKAGIKIIPMQRFHNRIPGWKYHITENPKPGEYRYLRFAWKADGAKGIMLQLHDEKDWNIRLTAGIDAYNWGTKFVADAPPPKWTVVTRDLFMEFGERTIQGIALTVFEGNAGYFDHIYFARTIDDLDRIDATGLGKGPAPQPTPAELDSLWIDLGGDDAARAYLAFWTLHAASAQSVPFLDKTLRWTKSPETMKQVRGWITQLDADLYAAREEAMKKLAEHMDIASGLLKKELETTPSAEMRLRIEQLLAAASSNGGETLRLEKGVQMLEFMKTPEAKKCLTELANGAGDSTVAEAAKAALKRMDAPPRD